VTGSNRGSARIEAVASLLAGFGSTICAVATLHAASTINAIKTAVISFFLIFSPPYVNNNTKNGYPSN
jgi:hypothetical protein